MRSEQAAEQPGLARRGAAGADRRRRGACKRRLAAARQALARSAQERDRLRRLRDETTQRGCATCAPSAAALSAASRCWKAWNAATKGSAPGPARCFALLEQPDPGPWRTVLGIVADFLTVRREYRAADRPGPGRTRPALPGARRRTSWPRRCASAASRSPAASASCRCRRPVPGTRRPARRLPCRQQSPPASPELHRIIRAIVALAEQVVRCDDPELADLPHRLLGNTLIVPRPRRGPGHRRPRPRGCRCVTLQGELLEPTAR